MTYQLIDVSDGRCFDINPSYTHGTLEIHASEKAVIVSDKKKQFCVACGEVFRTSQGDYFVSTSKQYLHLLVKGPFLSSLGFPFVIENSIPAWLNALKLSWCGLTGRERFILSKRVLSACTLPILLCACFALFIVLLRSPHSSQESPPPHIDPRIPVLYRELQAIAKNAHVVSVAAAPPPLQSTQKQQRTQAMNTFAAHTRHKTCTKIQDPDVRMFLENNKELCK